MRLKDRLLAAYRAFVLGQAAVDRYEGWLGKEDFQPVEYADYLTTSNNVYVCANLRADLLASLPLRLYRAVRGGASEVTRGELYELVKKPNPHWSFSRLIKMTEISLCLWGEAFWFLERGKNKGPVREIWWGRADCVKVHPHQTEYVSKFVYYPRGLGNAIEFDPDEVVWFRFPNPIDEFEGLSPLAASKIAADVASAAMKSNKNIFEHGLNVGGFIIPKAGYTLSEEQAKMLEEQLERRFRGADKAHRCGVFRFEVQWQQPNLTPKDAQFLEALRFSQEEVARAYRVPLDLIGGQRTYENYNTAMKAIWTNCIIPEAAFIADEINRQLVPLFRGVDFVKFDASQVEVLQEDRSEIVAQMQQLYSIGVPLNELLDEFMPQLKPASGKYPWGDVWWVASSQMPAGSLPLSLPEAAPEERKRMLRTADGLEFNGAEHRRLWGRFIRISERYVNKIAEMVRRLMHRQRTSIIDKLEGRAGGVNIDDLFDMAYWVKEFRVEMRKVLQEILQDVGDDTFDDLGITLSFDVNNKEVRRFIENRAQRFAKLVNETTWQELRTRLGAALEEGAGIKEMIEIVREVMEIRSTTGAEVIARTEAMGAVNGGMLEAWKQSGVVVAKTWLATLDDRVRDTHREAHGQTVPIDEDFEVGGLHGPAPGQIGDPAEDCNCRCTMKAVIGG